jgi:glycosyltransferase involved in cell wall biosynthesis
VAYHTCDVVATVAIALPVYNGADHLEEALRSFQRQSYPHFEIIVCDNVSTDRTGEIAQSFARNDPRFVYRRETNFLNARDNFIRAYKLTSKRHKYFLWACDDNVWHPEFLQKTVGYMEANPGASVCGVFLHHFGKGSVRNVEIRMRDVFKRVRLLHFGLERSSLVSLYSLMRREAVDSINLELRDIQDYPDRYYLSQLRCCGHFHDIEEDLLAFRAGGISSTGDDPWVRTVIDMNFGDREMKALFDLSLLSWPEKIVLAFKFTYIALRHNIPNTVWRGWLLPVYVFACFMNHVRPSSWKVTDRGLQAGGT